MTTLAISERDALDQAISVAARIVFDLPEQTTPQEIAALAGALQLAADSPVPRRPLVVVRNQWRIWTPMRNVAPRDQPLLWQKTFDCRARPDLHATLPLPQGIAFVSVPEVTGLHVDGVATLRRALLRDLSRRVHLMGDRAMLEMWRSVTAGAIAMMEVHAL